MIEKAYAKLNLTLEVIGKKDGYHLLESIVVPIDLYDILKFELADKDEVISNIYIENNNIYDAINLFKETFKIKEHVKVILTKNIPIGYGLGGSSADISATLRGLNKLFNLNKSLNELEELANKLGSDTLFCLYEKRSFIYGRGDKIIFSNCKANDTYTIILPKEKLHTKDVFKAYQDSNNYIGFKEHFITNNNEFINSNNKNDLLNAALSINTNLKDLYNKLINNGFKPNMTGSGSALYLINIENVEQERLSKILDKDTLTIITKEI